MTDHLDRPHCEKLKDWGMPQRVNAGGWVYWTGEIDEHFKGRPLLLGVDVVRIQLEHCENDWVLCPDLDELLEFARTLDPPKTFALVWEAADNTWAVVRTWDKKGGVIRKWITPRDDTPKLAVYKLIEKLMEVENEDD